ncbi:MAG: hypothetical protein WAT79_12990 [Saprospiraceae bacterium]
MSVSIPLLMSLILLWLNNPTAIEKPVNCLPPITCKSSVENQLPTYFQGKLMASTNSGENWKTIETNWPTTVNFQTFEVNENQILFGGDHAKIYESEIGQKSWVEMNLNEAFLCSKKEIETSVSSIFSTVAGLYAHVFRQGLFRQRKGTSFWVPVSIPETIEYIHDLKVDDDGNMYISCQEGIYVSKNDENQWEKIYATGWVGNMVLLHNELFASSSLGIIHSKDGGHHWNNLFIQSVDLLYPNDVKSHYNVNTLGNKLVAIRQNEQSNIGRKGFIQMSNDGGETWAIHPADQHLKNLKEVTSIIQCDGHIFCTYKEGVICSIDGGVSWKLVLKHIKQNNNSILKLKISNGVLYCWESFLGC